MRNLYVYSSMLPGGYLQIAYISLTAHLQIKIHRSGYPRLEIRLEERIEGHDKQTPYTVTDGSNCRFVAVKWISKTL